MQESKKGMQESILWKYYRNLLGIKEYLLRNNLLDLDVESQSINHYYLQLERCLKQSNKQLADQLHKSENDQIKQLNEQLQVQQNNQLENEKLQLQQNAQQLENAQLQKINQQKEEQIEQLQLNEQLPNEELQKINQQKEEQIRQLQEQNVQLQERIQMQEEQIKQLNEQLQNEQLQERIQMQEEQIKQLNEQLNEQLQLQLQQNKELRDQIEQLQQNAQQLQNEQLQLNEQLPNEELQKINQQKEEQIRQLQERIQMQEEQIKQLNEQLQNEQLQERIQMQEEQINQQKEELPNVQLPNEELQAATYLRKIQKTLHRILFWIALVLNLLIKLGVKSSLFLLTFFLYTGVNSVLLFAIPIMLIAEAGFGIASVKQGHQNERWLLSLWKFFVYIARLAIAALILNVQFGVFALPLPKLINIKVLLAFILLTYLMASITNMIQICRIQKKFPTKEAFELVGLLSSIAGIGLSSTSLNPWISVGLLIFGALLIVVSKTLAAREKQYEKNPKETLKYCGIFANTNDINPEQEPVLNQN